MTETMIRVAQGKGVALSALVGILFSLAAIIWQGGQMAEKLEATSAMAEKSSDEVSQIKQDLTEVRTELKGMSKNLDRILTRLDMSTASR